MRACCSCAPATAPARRWPRRWPPGCPTARFGPRARGATRSRCTRSPCRCCGCAGSTSPTGSPSTCAASAGSASTRSSRSVIACARSAPSSPALPSSSTGACPIPRASPATTTPCSRRLAHRRRAHDPSPLPRRGDRCPSRPPGPVSADPSLAVVLREWGRIGCLGFGGPPTHIALLRRLCVERRGWMQAHDFEDAVAACNLLPGPASTQLAIYCAWRQRGRVGALVGGAGLHRPRARPDPRPLGAVPGRRPAAVGQGRRRRGGRRCRRRRRARRLEPVPASWARVRGRADCAGSSTSAPAWSPRRPSVLGSSCAARVRARRGRHPARRRARRVPGGAPALRVAASWSAAAGCSRSPGSPSRSARSPTAAAS